MAEEEQARTPFVEQLRSLGAVYWIANWMELVERFAYYGVRTAVPIFMVLAISDGGPGLTHEQKGDLFGIWALVQSFVPIFTGVYADRYGYKLNIAIATALKIVGYLVMAYCMRIAETFAGMPLADARAAGVDHVYEIFFAGAMFVALGTAIFKPGVQGLLATKLPDKSSSLGWGLFYQMVNIGGFLGPLVGGYLQVLDWEWVFLSCTIGVALNFIPLFFFEEPKKEGAKDERTAWALIVDAVKGLLEPRLFFFTIAFAGFWLMFYQLFDILPNFIDDWVDSRAAATSLQSIFTWDGAVPTVNGGNLTQQWMINLNAGLISLFAFLVGYYTGKMRSLVAIVVGIAVSALGIYALGLSMNGWAILAAIGLFSVGEMLASPTKMRYLSSIAPPGRKGQYMGYVNFTVGIGWSIGSVVAGRWYEEGGDKINLARRYLEDHLGMAHQAAQDIDRGAVMDVLYSQAHVDAWGARELLWNLYEPYGMWVYFTLIGLASMMILVVYDRVTQKAQREPSFSFNTHGRRWVQIALVPVLAAMGYATYAQFSVALCINTLMFSLLLVSSFIFEDDHDDARPTEF